MSFNMPEMTSIDVISASWYGLHVAIHTDIFSSFMAYMLRHEVAIVLSGPPTGTRRFGRNHDNRVFGRNVAYSTWSIVLIATRHKRMFIFSSIHVAMTTHIRLYREYCGSLGMHR